jgi:hypothetical protein
MEAPLKLFFRPGCPPARVCWKTAFNFNTGLAERQLQGSGASNSKFEIL